MAGRVQGGCWGCLPTIFGAIFVVLGVGLWIIGAAGLDADAARVERLPLVTAGGVDTIGLGTTVAVQGTISERSPQRFRTFVAYSRQEYQGRDSDGDSIWRTDEVITPRLLLEIPGGTVEIAEGYTLAGALVQWQDSQLPFWDGSVGTKRYSGLERGSSVTAIGVTTSGREGVELQAETLAGGTRAEYVATQREGANALRLVGGIFAAVGGLFTLIALGGLLRGAAAAGGILALLAGLLRRP